MPSEGQHSFFALRPVLANIFCPGILIGALKLKRYMLKWKRHSIGSIALASHRYWVGLLIFSRSYLFERRQYVVVNGFSSSLIYVTSGVPKVSHWGALIFAKYIYDISKCFLHIQYDFYADDLRIREELKVNTIFIVSRRSCSSDYFFVRADIFKYIQ